MHDDTSCLRWRQTVWVLVYLPFFLYPSALRHQAESSSRTWIARILQNFPCLLNHCEDGSWQAVCRWHLYLLVLVRTKRREMKALLELKCIQGFNVRVLGALYRPWGSHAPIGKRNLSVAASFRFRNLFGQILGAGFKGMKLETNDFPWKVFWLCHQSRHLYEDDDGNGSVLVVNEAGRLPTPDWVSRTRIQAQITLDGGGGGRGKPA